MSEFLEYEVEFTCPKCDAENVEPVEFELQNRKTFITMPARSARCIECHTLVHLKPTMELVIEPNVDSVTDDEDLEDEETEEDDGFSEEEED